MSANYRIVISFVIIAFFTGSLKAREPLTDPIPALRDGVSAASLGVGGAGVALVSGAEAVFLNPAGCCEMGADSLLNAFISISQSKVETNLPSPVTLAGGMCFPVSFLKKSKVLVDPVIALSGFGYFISDLNIIDYNAETGVPIEKSGTQSVQDIVGAVTLSSPVIHSGNRWLVGFNGLLFQRTIFKVVSEWSYGVDFGMKLILTKGENKSNFAPPVSFGTRFRRIFDVTWKQDYTGVKYADSGWKYLDFGFMVGNEKNNDDPSLSRLWWNYTAFASQLRLDENKDIGISCGFILSKSAFNVRLGASNFYNTTNELQENQSVSLGLGWGTKSFNVDVVFRYYLNHFWRNMDGLTSIGFGI